MKSVVTSRLATFRLLKPADEDALWEMLAYAASMTEPLEEAIAKARADVYLSKYVAGFGTRKGDLGVAAELPDENKTVIGAAWLRVAMDPTPTPHAVATAEEPELAIGMKPGQRGSGIGTDLLRDLLARATPLYPAVRLSVRAANPSVRLYERLGFERIDAVVNRVGGESIVMRRLMRRLSSSQSSQS